MRSSIERSPFTITMHDPVRVTSITRSIYRYMLLSHSPFLRNTTTTSWRRQPLKLPPLLYLRQHSLVILLLIPILLSLINYYDLNHHPNSSHTNYRIWSTTYAFTAVVPDGRYCRRNTAAVATISTTSSSSHRFDLPKYQPQRGYRSTTGSYSQLWLSSSTNNNNNDTINGAKKNDDDAGQQQQKFEEDAKKMKVGELKQILESQGISTKTYIEKSEFIKAYIQLMMNGGGSRSAGNNENTTTTTNKAKSDTSSSASSSSSSTKKTSSSSSNKNNENTKDPEYRDVVMYKMNRSDPRMLQGTMIDVTVKK
jgi:hypothetical protein